MDDFTKTIYADRGDWAESEIEGNCAIVKVRASEETIKKLDETFQRLPEDKPADILVTMGVSATRRCVERYDARTGEIVCDGVYVPARSLASVDKAVSDKAG